ncbi:hypothetical protein MesoLj113a_50920 [Mesorhizobium sp. 113-1-2]|nr:hypothetical protein MesoLj113a_50920 [Mesorhizobium sp. 113-1-2]
MTFLATAIVFLSEILQRSVPKILLAAQMLHMADDAGLHPLRRRSLHPLWRRPGVLLDRFHSRSRIAWLELMNAEPT